MTVPNPAPREHEEERGVHTGYATWGLPDRYGRYATCGLPYAIVSGHPEPERTTKTPPEESR